MLHIDSAATIRELLDSNLDLAIELFKVLITSEHIKSDKTDHFGTYDIATLLNDIIKKDYQKGLSIIRFLEAEKELTVDQQIIYAFSLFGHRGNNESDDNELLLNIYADVVDPFLTSYGNDVIRICQRLPYDNCREAFVQFADRMAAKKKINEALRIIRIFVNDPDPYMPGKDPQDPDDKYNLHKKIENGEKTSSITSVRGWCGWVLMECAVLEGRDYLSEIIRLTKKLANDQNYYVIHMACHALLQLAKNRLTVLPSDGNVLFFNNNRIEALKMAKEVEDIAFELLNKLISWPVSAQKAIALSILRVFGPIRTLSEEMALKLVIALTALPEESIEESSSLFIYHAEFRKNNFKNWKFSEPGLYDYLDPDNYDSVKFKNILIETMARLQKRNPDGCFHFAALMEHLIRDLKTTDEDFEKYTSIAFEYFNILTNLYGHSTFGLIHRIIQSKLENPDKYLDNWFKLYVKCLKVEKDFYDNEKKVGNIPNVSWYPAMYHSQILELIHEKMDHEKFMKAAKIFFSFPEGVDFNESAILVSIIEKSTDTNDDAKKIIKMLIDRNPSKYWKLKSVLK